MILEIDAGNTRAKWRLRYTSTQGLSGVLLEYGAVDIMCDAEKAAHLLYESIAALPWEGVEKIWVSNVRGHDFEEALAVKLLATSGLSAEFPKSVKSCAGVTNGYDEPSQLGIDRWLAILAAYNAVKQQCCVVDCGTTITLDLVTSFGLHLGGYIVPGVDLMKSSLLMRSVVLQSDIQSDISTAPGRNTANAINNGISAMITGLIERVLAEERLSEHSTALLFTGGNGQVVKSSLALPSIFHPALVLDGLKFACSEPSPSSYLL